MTHDATQQDTRWVMTWGPQSSDRALDGPRPTRERLRADAPHAVNDNEPRSPASAVDSHPDRALAWARPLERRCPVALRTNERVHGAFHGNSLAKGWPAASTAHA